MKHRAMQMADDLGPVLGKPIRKAPETKAKPAPRWEKTATKGYLRDPATGAVARDADVPFDRQPLTPGSKAAEADLYDGFLGGFNVISYDEQTATEAGETLRALADALSGGWIAHDGGECPIPDALAGEWNLKWRNMPRDEKQSTSAAAVMRWSHIGTDCDITHYRLLPAYHARKAREAIPVGEATEVPSGHELHLAFSRACDRSRAAGFPPGTVQKAFVAVSGCRWVKDAQPERRAACIAALNALAKPEPAKPAVQTMLVDGVAYREAPEISEDFRCAGCAFFGKACFNDLDHMRAAVAKFGGQCRDRDVIYIRAEAA